MLAACQVLYQQAVVALPTRRSFTDLQLSARISAKLPMIVVTRWPAVRNRSQRSPGLRFATPVCRVCCFTEGGLYGFRHINRSALCHCRRTVFVLLEEQARLDCANTGHSGLMWDSGDFCRELGDRSIHLLDVLIACRIAESELLDGSRESGVPAKLYFCRPPIITNSPPSRPPDRRSRN